ncbi:MAG TPA: histidine kinase, partial [Anaerolineales bacterium]
MNQRTAHRLAWSSAALSIVLVATGLLLSLIALATGEGRVHLAPHQFFNPVITLTFPVVGALVASRHPRNPIGWMVAATGFLSSLGLLAQGYWMYSQAVMVNGALPGAELAQWLDGWVWFPQIAIPIIFLPLLFPDGQLLSPRWRPIAWLAGLGLAAGILGYALSPSLTQSEGQNPGELTPVASAAFILVNGAFLGSSVGGIGSLASLIVRFRRSRGIEREQLKWLVYGIGLALLIIMLGNTVPRAVWPSNAQELGIASTGVAVMIVIVAIGIAIVHHHLYDIDILINRTLVYGALTALIVAIYVLVVGVLGALLQARGNLTLSLLGVGLVAVAVQPMRDRLQRTVNRLMYGERDDPYAVLARLGQRLEVALAPSAVLSTLVETVAQSLKLPYVAIESGAGDDGRIAAACGQPVAGPKRFPLMFQAEIVGHLIVAPRASGEAFNSSEKNLLANIAHQAGAAVHAAQLTTDLQRSRSRLVTAREEERRRLRRDLHDGLGPILASQGLKLAAARHMLPGDPASVEALLDQVIAQNGSSVAEIRRLVYGLRPPALDERGLVEAIRDHVAGLDGRATTPVGLHVEVKSLPADLPSLPAAVEVAAYRIALEA